VRSSPSSIPIPCALIALNNLGEMERYQSWTGFEVEENRRRAREHLATRTNP
jgi:hypothetical protein